MSERLRDSDILRAIKLEPHNSEARQTRARHLILRSHAAEAIEQFESARADAVTSPILSL